MEKKLLLIDGSSYLYRAFYAMPALSTSQGEPSGAITGFFKMILNIVDYFTPEYLVVVFDGPNKTFRHTMYPDYKATREATPDDLVKQIQPIKDILTALGIYNITSDGVEADDIIGSLAIKYQHNLEVLIATKDKDLTQLVNQHVKLVDKVDESEFKIIDAESVLIKFGVQPAHIIDYLALCGDASDNVPGVKGIGPKTATSLLEKYPTLAEIYANLGPILMSSLRGKKSIVDKLKEYKEDALLSLQLVTIKTDVTVADSLQDFTQQTPNISALTALAKQYEQKTLYKYLQQTQGTPKNIQNIQHTSVTSINELLLLLNNLSKNAVVSFDFKNLTADYKNNSITTLLLYSATFGILELNFINQLGFLKDTLHYLRLYQARHQLVFVGYNAKNIAHSLHNIDPNLSIQIDFDIYLAAYSLNTTLDYSLAALIKKYAANFDAEYAVLGTDLVTAQDILQVFYLTKVYSTLQNSLLKEPRLQKIFYAIEMPLSKVLYAMEEWGVYVDKNALVQHSKELGTTIDDLTTTIYTLVEKALADKKQTSDSAPASLFSDTVDVNQSSYSFNIASPKQLAEVLYGKLGIPAVKKTATGYGATDEATLAKIAETNTEYREILQNILTYRTLTKLKSTYTDKLPQLINALTGRVHTSYNQTGTVTGRLSSLNPNLQNIPIKTAEGARIRSTFVAQQGYKIVAADYSQIELRIMAHLSQDENLRRAFLHDIDIHALTASEVLDKDLQDITKADRRTAKAVNFGLIYGISAVGLAKQLHITREEASLYIKKYFTKYPKVQAYMAAITEQAKIDKFVTTLCGRKIYIKDLLSNNKTFQREGIRQAINAPLQGSAADIIKLAMLAVHNFIQNKDIKLIMQVHDELVFEVQDKLVADFTIALKHIMEQVIQLSIPLVADVGVGESWLAAH